MLVKRAIIDQVETLRNGNLRVRFLKEVLVDGVVQGERSYHRTSEIMAGCPEQDLRQYLAVVQNHLAQMGFPIEAGEFDMVYVACAAHWKEEHRVAYREHVARAQAEIAQNQRRNAEAESAARAVEEARVAAMVEAALAKRGA